jgi:hypothetical protein
MFMVLLLGQSSLTYTICCGRVEIVPYLLNMALRLISPVVMGSLLSILQLLEVRSFQEMLLPPVIHEFRNIKM